MNDDAGEFEGERIAMMELLRRYREEMTVVRQHQKQAIALLTEVANKLDALPRNAFGVGLDRIRQTIREEIEDLAHFNWREWKNKPIVWKDRT